MQNEADNNRRDAAVLVTLLGTLAFTSPLLTWWLAEPRPWYLPFLMWGVLIVLVGLIQLRHPKSLS